MLSDEQKRANYDRYGDPNGPSGFGGGYVDMSDIFGGGFGGFGDIFDSFLAAAMVVVALLSVLVVVIWELDSLSLWKRLLRVLQKTYLV